MMDLENGDHILGFDFELEDHNLSAAVNHQILGSEIKSVKDVTYNDDATLQIGTNDIQGIGHRDAGNTNGDRDGWSDIGNQLGLEKSMDMETNNTTEAEVTNVTFSSSEIGHTSEPENESDFEELDLTHGMEATSSPADEDHLHAKNETSQLVESDMKNSEISSACQEEDHGVIQESGENMPISDEQSVNEGNMSDEQTEKGELDEQNTGAVEFETSECLSDKDEMVDEQNTGSAEMNDVDEEHGNESNNGLIEADSGESYEENEGIETEQGADNENVDNEQNKTGSLVLRLKPRKRKRKRKSNAKKWSRTTSPYRNKTLTPSPKKRIMKAGEPNTSVDAVNTSIGTSTVELEGGETLDDTTNSQDDGDAGTGNDSVTESPGGISVRRTSRPPSTRKDFYIDDDALLDEMWKQTDPSALYRKKRNSILFQKPKRLTKQAELKPLSEEEIQRYSEPFKHGWKREIVIRGCHADDLVRKNPPSDVYYFPPKGAKLRSMVQLTEWLMKNSSTLTADNFTFMRRPIGAEEGEMTRNASLHRGRISSEAHKRKRLKLEGIGDCHDDNDPLYDKPEIVIERDSDEFLSPLIAASISSPSLKAEKDPHHVPMKRGRPSKKSISPLKSASGGTKVLILHPSKEKCYLSPSRKLFKATARKSTTPKLIKVPIPYEGVENLCSLKCPGLEGVAPLLHCNICMCLFHKKCVNHFGEEDNFTCLRCDVMKKNGGDETQGSAPMHLDPDLVKTLNSLPLLSKGPSQMRATSGPVTSLVSTSGGSIPPLYKSLLYENMNEHRTKSPFLVQSLQAPINAAQPKSVQSKDTMDYPEISLATSIKQEPVDESYDTSMSDSNQSQNTSISTTDALSKYLISKAVSSKGTSTSNRASPYSIVRNQVGSPPAGKHFVGSQVNRKKIQKMPNPLNSMSPMIPLPNSGYQLIPIGPPLTNITGFPGQNIISNIRPAIGVPKPIQLIQSPSLIPLQITTNNVLQRTSSPISNSALTGIVSPSISSTVSTTDSTISQTGPVVVNAKSCAPLNGQLLTLPPAVVKRLTLSKPLALKINNRQINVPPSGFFQTAGGLKVFLPPNTFPTAEDNVVPGIDNKDQEDKLPTSDKKDESKSETSEMKADKDASNPVEAIDKSALIRKSKRYNKLCFFKMLYGAFESMEYIFKYLNIQDLVSASKVCKRWRTIAQNFRLWQHVSFRDMQVTDWRKAMQFLNKRQVKSISLVGLQHCNDPNRTWHQLVSSLQELQYLQQIAFGVVPASVLHSLTSRLTKLESFSAEHIADLNSDSSKSAPTKLDIGKFACMSELKELKLRGVHGLVPPSFSFSGGLAELGALCNLEVLSVTSLQDVSEDHFHFISQLLNIRELSLGNCTNWTQTTCDHLGQLIGLEKLCLEVGGESCQSHIGEAISHLKRLHTLELHDFPIEDNLGSHLKGLTCLKTLVMYPLYSANIAKDNTNALNAVSELRQLERLEWILPDKNRMSIILDDNDNKDDGAEEDSEFVPFLITASISEDEEIVASHTEYINPRELSEKLVKKLPKTQVKVYSHVVAEKEQD